jgi:putative copper resistance protein D
LELLFDLTGYLSVVLRGCVVAAQTATLGSIVFLLALARPLAPELGPAGRDLADGAARIGAWAALALAASGLAKLALQGALLADTVDLSLAQVLGANFALAGLAQMAAAVALAVVLRALGGAAPAWGLVPPALVLLLASISTTHAMARMDGRAAMLLASFLHQAGAAVWLGGLPCFLAALRRLDGQPGWRMVSARYSQLAIAGVVLILAGVAAFALAYIGSWQGLYGTAYGVMSGAKSAMLGLLLLLGLGNFLLIRGALAGGAGPVLRLRRFVEAEIGIGLAVLFAAASITSVPPSVDLPNDQVTWAELVERNTPRWPRLQSPDHDALAIPALQAQLDAAARAGAAGGAAFTPGAGQLPPRNAADIAWSEYNHHWAGFFVVLLGVLALLERAGLRAARHWPLVFLLLAGFLLLRSDPEVWPMGPVGFWESLRDVEVVQHRLAALLVVAFAVFEWRVRAGGLTQGRAALVFPLLCAVGSVLLLTHSHAIANTKEQLLIEISHTPLALLGLIAGWTRWLELRLDPAEGRWAGWVWPVCLVLVGLILTIYREA